MLNERNSVKDNTSKEDEKERYRKENILDKSLAFRIDTDIYDRTGSISETCNERAVDNVVSESEVIKFETYENGGETNVENHVENNLMEFEETFFIKTEPEINEEQFVQSKNEGTGKTFPYMFDTYTSNFESLVGSRTAIKPEPLNNSKENDFLVCVGEKNLYQSSANMNEKLDIVKTELKMKIDEENENVETLTRVTDLSHIYDSSYEKTDENIDIKVETDEEVYINEDNKSVDAETDSIDLKNDKVYIKTEPLSYDTEITDTVLDYRVHNECAVYIDTVYDDLKAEYKIVKSEKEDDRDVNCSARIKHNDEDSKSNNFDALTESEGKTYDCRFCGKSFPTPHHLNGHSRVHVDKIYQCDQCDKAFGSLKNLKAHQANHGDKIFSCFHCNKSFAKETLLKQHRNVHTKEQQATCSVCGQSFSRATDLKRHVKLHTMERDHVCGICGRSFVTPYELKYHMPTHDEQRQSYTCSICNKSYKYERDLKSHMSVHSVDSRHICMICEKVFDKKFNLNRHLRTHTADRPFSCDLCGKSFKDPSNLKLHQLRHNKTIEKSTIISIE